MKKETCGSLWLFHLFQKFPRWASPPLCLPWHSRDRQCKSHVFPILLASFSHIILACHLTKACHNIGFDRFLSTCFYLIFFSNVVWKNITYKTYMFNIKDIHLKKIYRSIRKPSWAPARCENAATSRWGRAKVPPVQARNTSRRPGMHGTQFPHVYPHLYGNLHYEARSTKHKVLPSYLACTSFHGVRKPNITCTTCFTRIFPEVVPTSTSSSFLSSKEGSLQEQPLHFKSLWIIGIIKMNLELS